MLLGGFSVSRGERERECVFTTSINMDTIGFQNLMVKYELPDYVADFNGESDHNEGTSV